MPPPLAAAELPLMVLFSCKTTRDLDTAPFRAVELPLMALLATVRRYDAKDPTPSGAENCC